MIRSGSRPGVFLAPYTVQAALAILAATGLLLFETKRRVRAAAGFLFALHAILLYGGMLAHHLADGVTLFRYLWLWRLAYFSSAPGLALVAIAAAGGLLWEANRTVWAHNARGAHQAWREAEPALDVPQTQERTAGLLAFLRTLPAESILLLPPYNLQMRDNLVFDLSIRAHRFGIPAQIDCTYLLAEREGTAEYVAAKQAVDRAYAIPDPRRRLEALRTVARGTGCGWILMPAADALADAPDAVYRDAWWMVLRAPPSSADE